MCLDYLNSVIPQDYLSEQFDWHFCFRPFASIFVNKKKLNGERFCLDLVFVFMLYLNYCRDDWLYWDRGQTDLFSVRQ